MPARHLLTLLVALAAAPAVLGGCGAESERGPAAEDADPPVRAEARVPDWARDAVFYQIFPERFANGDPTNDPTRQTLQKPVENVPESWAVSPWTGDWYEQADWEKQMGGFYDSVFERRYGGDLQGVIDRLPYLDSLGVTAVYFNPVFWANSLHKYDANTYHHVDPHFGPDPAGDKALIRQETPTDPSTWQVTAADSLFFDLLRRAHRRDIRVVIDGVFNHTGRDFFAFDSLQAHQAESRYADWYAVRSFDDPATPDTSEFDYAGWWGIASLPEFANSPDGTTLRKGPREYIFAATRRWMDPNGDGDPSDGVDGWRLDVAGEVPTGFWQAWNRHVREINPEAYTVAEDWEAASGFVREGRFSATMNYHAFAMPVKGFLIDNALSPSRFAALLNERRRAFAEPVRPALLNLIDSHDTPRLASMIANRSDTGYVRPERFDYDWGEAVSPREAPAYDVSAPEATGRQVQRLVALFQMTYVGTPMVYYGTEAGMWGADDPDDRKPMVWPDRRYAVENGHPLGRDRPPDPVSFDDDLFRTYQTLIALRKQNAALRRGGFSVLQADDDRRLFAFARATGGPAVPVVVVINRSGEAHSTRIALPDSLQGAYEPIYRTPAPADPRVQQDASGLVLEVPPRSGLVLRRRPDGGP